MYNIEHRNLYNDHYKIIIVNDYDRNNDGGIYIYCIVIDMEHIDFSFVLCTRISSGVHGFMLI